MGLFDFLKKRNITANKAPSQLSETNATHLTKQELVVEATVKDIDGNVYTSVKIGNQIWTKENLKTTKYNDGTLISLVTEKSEWAHRTIPGYCWYENNKSNKEKYGALYNWHTIITDKLAPKGWHVPTEDDWTKLKEYLIANGYNWDGTKEGNKIAKSMATKMDWKTNTNPGLIGNDLNKNNASCFSALPGGCRGFTGSFSAIGDCAIWWNATEDDTAYAWNYGLWSDEISFCRNGDYKSCGFSVRFLRDSN